MKKYEYKFVKVPASYTKIRFFYKSPPIGSAYEACKGIITAEAAKGWRLKQVVVPFNETCGVYMARCYQVIFEREIEDTEEDKQI